MEITYDPQEYKNLILLLEQALKFYNDENNYKKNNNNQSLIDLDKGEQAKFALNNIKDFHKKYDGVNYLYELSNTVYNSNKDVELEKMINIIKEINKEY